MIVRSRGGDVALAGYGARSIDQFGPLGNRYLDGTIPPPSDRRANIGTGGPAAVGIPAALNALTAITETGAQLPFVVNRPDGEGSMRARDSWQWELLHEKPNQRTPPVTFFEHGIASMLGHGGSCILKTKARGRVQELFSMDRRQVTVTRKDGELRFTVRNQGSAKPKVLTREDVIYIPMHLLDDPEIGVSPIMASANAVEIGLTQQEFEARFYLTDGAPAEVVTLGGPANAWTPSKRTEFRDSWENRHKPGSRKLGLLWGESTYEQIGLSLKDAEYADAAALTTTRAAQIFKMPIGILDGAADQFPDATDKRFREITVQPILTKIEQGLHADDDLFPPAEKDLRPQALTAALLRPSIKDRADSYRLFRQGGIATANELRALEDWPHHPDGDVLQATPVGGAPNPNAPSPDGPRSDH